MFYSFFWHLDYISGVSDAFLLRFAYFFIVLFYFTLLIGPDEKPAYILSIRFSYVSFYQSLNSPNDTSTIWRPSEIFMTDLNPSMTDLNLRMNALAYTRCMALTALKVVTPSTNKVSLPDRFHGGMRLNSNLTVLIQVGLSLPITRSLFCSVIPLHDCNEGNASLLY